MRAIVAALLFGCACSATPPCPIDLADAGCSTSAACADAGEGLACTDPGRTCQLCVPSYHSYVARCEAGADGGLGWAVSVGIPPPGCPPSQ